MTPHPIQWKREAIADLIGIGLKIAADSPLSAERMISLIESKLTPLVEHPNLGKSGRKRGVRELLANDNYLVVYRILPTSVEILRIKHSQQQWP